MVVISGAPGTNERRNGFLLHHQVKHLDSQMAIFREITCDQCVLDDPQRAPEDIARVLRSAITHSRPVYIELPRDMVHAPCARVHALPAPGHDADALAACVEEVLARLEQAARPVLMVDIEIRRFGLEGKVAQLATKLQVPVVTCFMGRGLLASEPEAPLLGTYLGVAGAPEVTEAVEGSDALLMLGVILSDTNFGVQRERIDLRKCMLALDGDVTLGYHTYHDIPLEALVDGLLAHAKPLRADAALRGERTAYPCDLPADDSALVPRDVASAINDMMRKHGRMTIASDIGDCLFTALDIENTDLLAPGYYATMGYGVPAAFGLQAAGGERPLVLVGDGAFQMTGWELGNCQRYGLDPIVVIFNNCSWEMLRAFQPQSGFCDLSDWRFADMAQALGGDGYRVTTRAELVSALECAVQQRGRFQLVEVMLPRGGQSDTLARFVNGVRRLQGSKA
jgi:indolepyruvate decarboxylase